MVIDNFRDLHYLTNRDGLKISPGLIFRGPALNKLDQAGEAFIDSLKLKKLIDLRSYDEVATYGADYKSTAEYLNIPAFPRAHSLSQPIDFKKIDQEETKRKVETLKKAYREMVFTNKAFAYTLNLLAYPQEALPFYYHCSAGKDRTGVLTLLILKLLNFSDETILHDYLLSKEVWLKVFLAQGKKKEEISPLMQVQEEWLKGSIDAIMKRYGSFETYFKAEYGFDEAFIKHVRKGLLQ